MAQTTSRFVGEQLVEADRGRDRRAASGAEQEHGHAAGGGGQDGEQDLVEQPGEMAAVALVGKQTHLDAEPPVLGGAGDPLQAAGQASQHRQQGGQLVGDQPRGDGRVHHPAGTLAAGEGTRLGDQIEPERSRVSVPSSTARARKVAATSGGTDSP
jgi:hypothetical protein